MNRHLLLISNSTNAGEAYLAWPQQIIADFFKRFGIKRVLFVPYAGVTPGYDNYAQKVAKVFEAMGVGLDSVHTTPYPVTAVQNAECIVVGGGNTFHLVREMQRTGIMEAIREKVLQGCPYMGWSAGSNVACPTIKTTNDMPIVEPESFNALNLVPIQINPHYLDANPEGHGGETREDRIREFMVVNPEVYVAGLREATYLEVEGNKMTLGGKRKMRLFKAGEEVREIEPGDVSFLL
ncbi:MAG: dipeptidase PepE [Bacteroides sp.]|nr:dipeptidase PepE [Bacteroides sp.]